MSAVNGPAGVEEAGGGSALSAADLEAIRAVFARRLYVMDTKQ